MTHRQSRAGPAAWPVALLLVLACVAIYSNALSGPFVYDDELSIVNNGLINANANGLALNIDPISSGSFTNAATGTLRASNRGRLTAASRERGQAECRRRPVPGPRPG